LYEAAATRPERRNLADVRRGQYEALVKEILLPDRAPDFGPARVGPAGAVVVGARDFLVAYNFFLDSADVHIARAIAQTIRQSSGGLPGVKAIGLLVGGRAQVSVNLVDYRQTPLHVLSETVDQLAREHGTTFVEAELIGLLPQDVVLAAAAHSLKLPGLPATRVIEPAIAMASRKART
ncbi:MAG: glutamate formiminotransferase, partial [Caldilineaceae bacterium]|nr:glutamate formiminotransferase [Caldilineaceae bacterium]